MSELAIRNRQRLRRIDLPRLRRVARALLDDLLAMPDYELGIHLVRAREMTRLNETFLHHQGSTDVITFDYGSRNSSPELHGEVFISVDDAAAQAPQFRTTWEKEIVRYLVHGVLHLRGYDDGKTAGRRRMKRLEDRLLAALGRRFALSKLTRKPTVRP